MVFRAVNQLRDYCLSLRPAVSDGTETQHTAIGVFRKSKPGGKPGGDFVFPWEQDWEDIDYEKDDVVILRDDEDFEDGTRAGTYIALQNIPQGTPVPGTAGAEAYWDLLAKNYFEHLKIKRVITLENDPESTEEERAASLVAEIDMNSSLLNGKRLYPQEFAVCVGGVQKKAMILMSDPYE